MPADVVHYATVRVGRLHEKKGCLFPVLCAFSSAHQRWARSGFAKLCSESVADEQVPVQTCEANFDELCEQIGGPFFENVVGSVIQAWTNAMKTKALNLNGVNLSVVKTHAAGDVVPLLLVSPTPQELHNATLEFENTTKDA